MAQNTMTDALDARAKWLETESRRLEGLSAVKRVQRALGYYLDQAAWDEAADLFAEDGTLEVALDGVYRGRERIRQYLYALGGGRRGLRHGDIHECMQLQPVVHVAPDGRTARGRWRAFLMAGRFGERAVWGEGPIEARYVSQDAAPQAGRRSAAHGGSGTGADRAPVWRIASLHVYQTFVVPYDGTWVRNTDVTGGKLISARLAPDAPPTERYETWPGVYTPALHFTNPVEVLHPPAVAAQEGSAGVQAGSAPPDRERAGQVRAIAALEQRLLLLHDVAQIENLVSAYGYYLDKQQWDALAALFADDATMEISQRGVYVGRESIRRALELFGPQGIEPNHVHNHMQLQPVIHVSADRRRAWVRSRAFSQLGVYPGVGIWHGGLYENELVNQDGVWKFQRDHVYTTYFGHCDQGWATGARPAPKPSEKIPPDRPATEVYESFPDVYIPAYHYRHPVTGQPIDMARRTDAGASATAPVEARGVHAPQGGSQAAGAPHGQAQPHAFPPDVMSPLPPLDVRALPAGLAETAARLQRLEDECAIESLQRSYGYFVDKALWQETADLFTDDGTLEIGGRGVFVGKARVLDYLRWLQPKGLVRGKLFDHLQLQPIVTIAPDGLSARGRWRFFAQVGDYEKSALWGLGTYENEYVKERGVWKIRTLHSYFRMYTPYADGWARTAVPNTRPEQDLPPDRPPTVVHEQYPGTFIPGCHYPHPATGK